MFFSLLDIIKAQNDPYVKTFITLLKQMLLLLLLLLLKVKLVF